MLLQIKDINSYYGNAHVLHGISLEVDEGEVTCLLGRNGVGKSTILKSIAGVVDVKSGSIDYKGRELVGLAPYRITRLGLGYVPEERRIFSSLTVEENLIVGLKSQNKNGKDFWTIDKFYDLYPEIKKLSQQKGGHLSGGEQQILTIGRTLMGNPDLIMVDEPTEGLAPLLIERIFQMLEEIKKSGTSILLVENSITGAVNLASKIYVISKGEVVFQGSSDEFIENKDIRKTYIEVSETDA
jgi:branched-chain amino acid transport system ATP-binding protein